MHVEWQLKVGNRPTKGFNKDTVELAGLAIVGLQDGQQ